jgi:hypothetical protein
VHPWTARVEDFEHADQIVVDLDPGEGHAMGGVTATALRMSRVFLQLGRSRQRLHCLAGHVGFEPANPPASYLIGFAWQLHVSSASRAAETLRVPAEWYRFAAGAEFSTYDRERQPAS